MASSSFLYDILSSLDLQMEGLNSDYLCQLLESGTQLSHYMYLDILNYDMNQYITFKCLMVSNTLQNLKCKSFQVKLLTFVA